MKVKADTRKRTRREKLLLNFLLWALLFIISPLFPKTPPFLLLFFNCLLSLTSFLFYTSLPSLSFPTSFLSSILLFSSLPPSFPFLSSLSSYSSLLFLLLLSSLFLLFIGCSKRYTAIICLSVCLCLPVCLFICPRVCLIIFNKSYFWA